MKEDFVHHWKKGTTYISVKETKELVTATSFRIKDSKKPTQQRKTRQWKGYLLVRKHVSNEINALKTTAVPTRAPGMLQSSTYTVHVDSFSHYAFWKYTACIAHRSETKSENNNQRNANILIYWCGNNIKFEKQDICVLNCNIWKNKQLLRSDPKGRDPANEQAINIAPLFTRKINCKIVVFLKLSL